MIPPISHGFFPNESSPTSSSAEEHLPTQEDLASKGLLIHQQISQTLSGSLIYHYLAFLLAMLVLDLTLRVLSRFIRKQKEDQLPPIHGFNDSNSTSSSKKWKSKMMKAMIFYTGIYCCYQVVMMTLGFNNNHDASLSTMMSHPAGEPLLFESKERFRLLEEGTAQDLPGVGSTMISEEKISFSLGKVMTSLNLKANNIVVTKNLKYAFVVEGSAATMKVLDISNSPNVIKAVPLSKRVSSIFRPDYIHLSPDEKTLFVSCLDALHIIDVTYPESAQLIGVVDDPDFSRVTPYLASMRFSISFALSADSKTLLVGGLGLQAFDVSDLSKPILLSSQNFVSSDKISALNIALTSDKKTLWIANGTLDSYDFASDPRNPKLMNSFSEGSNQMRSIILSRDNKIAFILGNLSTSRNNIQEIQLAKVDISNPNSPVLLKSYIFHQESLSPAFLVGLSAKERYVFISTNPGRFNLQLVVFDLVEGKVLNNDQSLLKDMGTVTAFPNGNFVLASSHTKMELITFYKNFPNKEIFSLTEYPIETFEMKNETNSIDFSRDGKYLFVAGSKFGNPSQTLYIYELEGRMPRKLISSFEADSVYQRLRVSEDLKKVFLSKREEILIVDISNLQSPILYSKYKVSGYSEIEDSYFWDDAKISFMVINRYDSADRIELRVFNYSIPKSPKKIYSSSIDAAGEQGCKVLFLKERNALLMVGSNLNIYDVSNVSSPLAIGSLGICTGKNELIFFAKISSDGKTLFVEIMDRTSFHKLKIYDIADLKNPKPLGEVILPMFNTDFGVIEAEMTKDSKTVYLLQHGDENILRIDLSNIKAPRVSGILPFKKKFGWQIKLSADDKTMYLTTNRSQLHAMSLQSPRTLYLNQEKFYIGHGYSDNAMMLQFDNKSADYRLMKNDEYKFIGMGLCEIGIDSTEFYAKSHFHLLPNWASFDKANQVLTIQPKNQIDLGYHTLYAVLSNKVPKSAFNSILESTAESKDLITNLISLGYLNNQLFLTSDFGKIEDFYLPAKYENMTEQIYNTLAQYYIIACTTINILPSLEVKRLVNGLSVISPSENYVKIEIQLSKSMNTAQFVHRSYGSLLPTITDSKSHLSLEGSIHEVNSALKNLTIDFTNIEGCSAEMLVMDGMNPSIRVSIDDVAKHFQINAPPILNKAVQKQIDDIPIYTGQYFSINFDSDTIKDIHPDISLNYKLVLNATAENNETLPNWISLNDLTLKGIAPEEFFKRDIGFALIASNEFKNLTVPFVLHVRISSTYVAKLIARYSPYILTLVGLIIKANKIYNVVCKRRYRHRKEFIIKVGEEINNDIIFPIAFIKEEKTESGVIFNSMMKSWRIDQFINEEGTLEKEKIVECIQETVKEKISMKETNRLGVYLYGVDSRKQIVERLVVNKLIWLQLSRDYATKKIFEKIKNQWTNIIEFKNNNFQVDQKRLNEIIKKSQDSSSFNDSSLLDKSKKRLNLDLLVNGLEAYAFECQSVDTFAIKCTVEIKEKLKGGCIRSLLKHDIHRINYNSPLKVNYGVNCRFENGSLVFSGTPCEDFKRRTLVVQISNGRLRILKEIWIFEDSGLNNVEVDWKSLEKKSSFIKNENQAQGQYYEVF